MDKTMNINKHYMVSFLSLLLLLFVLYACKSKVEERYPAPDSIKESTECVIDGMLLVNYPGPKAQIFYNDKDSPDFICETKPLFRIYLQPGMKTRIRAIYVQDTSQIDWKHPKGGWIDAFRAWYVVGSRLKGSMGYTYAPFTKKEDAIDFAQRYGGKVMNFESLLKEVKKKLN